MLAEENEDLKTKIGEKDKEITSLKAYVSKIYLLEIGTYIHKVWAKKLDTLKNWPLTKNPQFLSNFYENLSKWLPLELIILTKFCKSWTKIVDFLLMVNFLMRLGFFTQTLCRQTFRSEFDAFW